jgi:hypothetical protein
MIGADGREYGPMAADQLRQWIVEGRANAQTQVLPEGAPTWKQLGELPEFAEVLRSALPLPGAPGPYSVSRLPETNTMGVVGMILGILSLTCGFCCYGLPFNALGIVFSLIALFQIKSDPIAQRGRGMAIAGLVLSILSIVVWALVFALGLALNGSEIFRKFQDS